MDDPEIYLNYDEFVRFSFCRKKNNNQVLSFVLEIHCKTVLVITYKNMIKLISKDKIIFFIVHYL